MPVSQRFYTLSQLHRMAHVAAVIVLLPAGCGFYDTKSGYEQMKEENQSFSDLVEAAGGSAERRPITVPGFQNVGWIVDLSGAEITEDLIEKMLEYNKRDPFLQLNLSDSTITDEQLAQLDAGDVLQKVYTLDLKNTGITDAGLDGISNFYVIHELWLKGTQVTLEAVERLGDKQLAQKYTPKPLRTRPKVDIE
ncbi:MAG: hypothetical protein ABGZ35_28995 [Planctomycetaceae bacterium]